MQQALNACEDLSLTRRVPRDEVGVLISALSATRILRKRDPHPSTFTTAPRKIFMAKWLYRYIERCNLCRRAL